MRSSSASRLCSESTSWKISARRRYGSARAGRHEAHLGPGRRLDGSRVGHARLEPHRTVAESRLSSASAKIRAAMDDPPTLADALLARLIDHAPTLSARVAAARPRRSRRTRARWRARTRSCSRGSSGRRRGSPSSRVERALSAFSTRRSRTTPSRRRASRRGIATISRRSRASRARSTSRFRSTSALERATRRARRARAAREGAVRGRGRFRAPPSSRGSSAPAASAAFAFKATAGLHHAVRSNGEHGFLNLLAAVVFGDEEAALAETDPDAFALDADVVRWRDRSRGADELARARRERAPLDRELQLLRAGRGARGARECSRCERRRSASASSRSTAARRASASASGDGVLDLAAAGLGAVFEAATLNPFLALGRAAWEDTLARVDELVDGRRRARPARGRRRRTCRSRSATTSTSTRRSSTRRTSAASSARTPSRCSRTGATSRSATTAAPGPSSSAARRSCGRAARRRRRTSRRPALRAEPAARHRARARLRRRGRRAGSASPCRRPAFRDHVFGVVLVNDWSARDIQAWEYQPLGPFLGKSFATSIAAWVTPLALLEDRFVPPPQQEPEPLPYLRVDGDWALDVELEVELSGTVVSRTNARGLYWTMPQQLAHATVNGASIRDRRPLRLRDDLRGRARARRARSSSSPRNGARSARARRRPHANVPRGRRRGRASRAGGRGRARRGARDDPAARC